jgi:hypothetical protein
MAELRRSIQGRLLDSSMRETENIRPSVVARYIKTHALAVDHGKIEIGNDELFTIVNGFYYIARVGPDDRAPSTLNPGFLNFMGQLGRNIGCPHHQADCHYKASPLEGVVPAGELCYFVHSGPDCHVNVLSGLVHCHPRKWHPVFPANQSPNACLGYIHGRQPSAISRSPHETFGEGWDQLGMMVGHAAIG